MKMKFFGMLALVALVVSPSFADDNGKRKNKRKKQARGMAVQLINKLDAVQLTDDQAAKVNELGKKADAKAKDIREEFELTRELMRKRAQAQRELKEAGKKGKELFAAINERVGITEDQVKGLKQINAVRAQLQKDVIALLSEEQKEALPDRMKRTKKQGKGKRKKQSADAGVSTLAGLV